MGLISVGASLPLELQLHDGATNKFPRARVYDQAGVEVTGSPFALTHLANGLYRNTAYTVLLANQKLVAAFITYDDAGFTTESVFHTRAVDQWDVETRVETVNTKLGTPAGASVSADIAATHARIGAPVGASISADIAAVQSTANTINTKIGTPAGASVSADIAAVKADTAAILDDTGTTGVLIANGAITAAKFATGAIDANAIADGAIDAGAIAADAITAAKIADGAIDAGAIAAGAITAAKFAAGAIDANAIADNAIDGGALATSAIDKMADGVWDEPLAGHTTAGTTGFQQNSIDEIWADTDDIQARIGTPVGASISADIAAARASIEADIADVQADTDDIQAKIGTPVSTVSADIAAVKSDTAAILDDTGTTGVAIANGAITAAKFAANAIDANALATDAVAEIADGVWDEPLAGHVAAGTTGAHQNLLDDIEQDTASLNDVKITTTRANNLDNLDTTVSSRASQTSVTAIQNTTRIAIDLPPALKLPTAGSKDYKFYAQLFDTDGNPEDPDSNTLNYQVTELDGTVVVATAAMTRTGVGLYEGTYTVTSTDVERPLRFNFTYNENSVAFTHSRATEVVEFESKLDTLLTRLTSTRAGYLDNLPNLDVAVSTRESEADAASRAATDQAEHDATQAALVPIQADTDDIQSKIGTPVTSVSADIAAVKAETASIQSDTNDIQAKIGTPVVTVSADIAAVKAETASIQSDTNDIQAKIGTPASTVSDDIAAVKADTAAILVDTGTTGVLVASSEKDDIVDRTWDEPLAGHMTAGTTGQALFDAGATAATPEEIADAVWDEPKAGHTTVGSFGESNQGIVSVARANNLDNLDVAVSTRESDASAATRHTAQIAEHDATQAALVPIQADTDDIQAKIGVPVASVSADIAAVKADTTAIKAKTDQLAFTAGEVHARALTVLDKTGYTLTGADQDAIVDKVWDEQLLGHAVAGSAGKTLADLGATSTPGAIADAVWDELVAAHANPGSFGLYIDVIRQFALDIDTDVNDPTTGLQAIHAEVINRATALTTEVNQNETKIDAIIPAVNAARNVVVAEVDQNQTAIGNLSTQLAAVETNLDGDIAGVAAQIAVVDSKVGALRNNTRVRFVIPERLIKPTSGTKDYEFRLYLYDDEGNPEAPDAAPTLRIRRLDTGVDVVAGAAMTQDGVKVGAYFYQHTISSGTALYPLLVEVAVVEGGVTRYYPALSEITEFESDLNQIQSELALVKGDTTTIKSEVQNGVYGLSALKTGQAGIVSEVNANETLLNAIKAKTDLIPANIATAADVAAVGAQVLTRPDINAIQARLDLLRDNLKGVDNRDLTQVYDRWNLTGVAMTSDPRFANLDAPVSSRSTLTAAQVWGHATRTLTAYGLDLASIDQIWAYLASGATTPGSIGKRIADFLDVAISTRATAVQVSAALAGVAQESTVLASQGALTTEINANELKINQVLADTTAIKAKTTNLPSSPASTSDVTSAIAPVATGVANVDLRTIGIKSKTDALPPDPAKESTVQARPTNPLLATDPRVNRLDVPVSSRSTLGTGDLAPLAKTADVTSAQSALTTEINQNETKLNTLQSTATAIKAKTDTIPSDPVTDGDLAAAKTEILDAIDDIPGGGGGGLTASDVWSFPTRELTTDPSSFGPDVSGLAEKTDLTPLARIAYESKMSTAFNNTSGQQEILAWAEKDGQRVAGTNCVVTVKTSLGVTVWTATQASPNADGVFRLTNAITAAADANYYVEVSIVVDSVARLTRHAFVTVG